MKTVVYQSFRTVDVPPWVERCMGTVRDWARLKGFDYSFFGDEIFDRVPDWYREKARGRMWLMTDLGRLELARELIESGYDRTIWVDADIVVFDAERFEIDVTEEYAFCLEVWIHDVKQNEVSFETNINNAVTVFVKNNSFLEFYIHACKDIVRHKKGEFDGLEVSTRFLTDLRKTLFFPVLTTVGLFSPIVSSEIAKGGGPITEYYINKMGAPIRAANLGTSWVNKPYKGVLMNNAMYASVIDRLVETRGDVVNRALGAPAGIPK